jgi:molecular chaperone GrpE
MTDDKNANGSEKVKKKRDEKIAELEAKCEEYLAGWKRALADYDNLKRDLSKERDSVRSRVAESLADGFVKVLDNFDQAVVHVPNLDDCSDSVKKQINAWINGVSYVRTAMTNELKSLGLETFEPDVGSQFDSSSQEPAESREEEGMEEGKIIKVVLRGWKIGEKIIRPARVIISK